MRDGKARNDGGPVAPPRAGQHERQQKEQVVRARRDVLHSLPSRDRRSPPTRDEEVSALLSCLERDGFGRRRHAIAVCAQGEPLVEPVDGDRERRRRLVECAYDEHEEVRRGRRHGAGVGVEALDDHLYMLEARHLCTSVQVHARRDQPLKQILRADHFCCRDAPVSILVRAGEHPRRERQRDEYLPTAHRHRPLIRGHDVRPGHFRAQQENAERHDRTAQVTHHLPL